jgi:hypothetical protein
MLGRGGSLPKAMAEPASGLAVVQGTVEGVAFFGIREGQLAKLGRGRVCFEAKADFGRGVSQGTYHALSYARPIQSCLNSTDDVGEQ